MPGKGWFPNPFPTKNMAVLLVTCLFPDESQAMAAAGAAVTQGVAACCQVGTPVRSVYRWEGRIEQAVEVPLHCKTTEAAWPALESLLTSLHPYEVPEIVAVPVAQGLPAYLNWVEETLQEPTGAAKPADRPGE